MDDQDLPTAGSKPARKRTSSSKVIEFPVHRRGSLADTLSGFPERDDGPPVSATRRERSLTLVVADLRGRAAIAERLGAPTAEGRLDAAGAAAVEVLRSHGGEQVAVGGQTGQPVAWAEFTGDDHATRAVAAAAALRDAVGRAAEGVEACVGLNTGLVVDASVGGASPVSYRAMGTLRMFAVRLQEFAGPGQILAAASTVAALPPGTATFRAIGPVRTNAGGETSEAYSLLELAGPSARSTPASDTSSNATG